MNREEHIEKNKGVIHLLAKKYFIETPKFAYDDLLSEANKAAIIAIDSFDESRGTQMVTHIYNVVSNNIRNFVSKNKYDLYITPCSQNKEYKLTLEEKDKIKSDGKFKYGGSTSPNALSMNYTDKAGCRHEFSETIPSGAPPVIDNMIKMESEEILIKEVEKLPKKEKDVIIARFFDGKKLREIAADFGVSKQRIEQIQKKALNNLKSEMSKKLHA